MVQIKLTVERVGDLRPNYKEICQAVVEEEGFVFFSAIASDQRITIGATSPPMPDEQRRLTARRIEDRLRHAVVPRQEPASGPVYVNYGQTGAMGDGAMASHNKFQQVVNKTTPQEREQLVAEVVQLCAELKKREDGGDEAEADAGAAAQAKVEAKKGNFAKALGFLADRGKGIVEVAESMGLKLLTRYISDKLGLPPGGS